MIKAEGESDHAAPRVPHHNCLFYSHHLERVRNESRLGCWRPHSTARTVTMAKSRSVKRHDPAMPGRLREEAAYLHIGKSHAVAMKQYHGGSRTSCIDCMQPHAAHLEEGSSRRKSSLSVKRVLLIQRR